MGAVEASKRLLVGGGYESVGCTTTYGEEVAFDKDGLTTGFANWVKLILD